MNPDINNTATEIVNNQGNVWNIGCLSQLKTTYKLINSDIVSLQSCIFLSMDEPSRLGRILEDATIEYDTEA